MLAYLFVALAIGFRFIHHPVAFTPVGASLLYFGARQPRSRIWIPLAALIVSDLVLTRFSYGYPFVADQFVIWAWYAAVMLMGGILSRNSSLPRLAVAAIGTSVSFFLISNFAVWVVWRNLYPATLSGLMTCYAVALPFFRNEIAADALFTAVFFGIGAAVAHHKEADHRIAA
jgi:hypothetical protein